MKFTKRDLDAAIADLGTCRFFPTDPAVHASVQMLLCKICPSKEALNWLIDAMVNKVGEWKGPAELRGILCWKFKPSDGIEGISTVPGFRWQDGEEASLAEHEQLKVGGWSAPKLEQDRKLVKQIAGGVKWPK